jgi:DNA-binding HxlR family transcriptional regulator
MSAMSKRGTAAEPRTRTSDEAADGGVEYDVFGRSCPSRGTLEAVTNRWGSLALSALRQGPMRFNELRRRVDGVSQKMLAQALQALERDGFVQREVLTTFPLHVRYSLTALGEETAGRLAALISLIESRMPTVLQAQQSYDRRPAAVASDHGGELE